METKFNLKFIDQYGTFTIDNPHKFKRLYFPLLNETGFISSITPDLKGDIKTSQHSFLTVPVSVEDLYLTKSSRNFWVQINKKKIWSATGVSAFENSKDDIVKLEAGLLYHKIKRINQKLKIKSEIINFVPSSNKNIEIMLVQLTNLSNQEMILQPFFGMPLFCRSAENLRDHRNVTSMLNRAKLLNNGIMVKPTMLFSEAGHKINNTIYYVGGFTDDGKSPEGFFPTVMDYVGETGDFEKPEAVLQNKKPVKKIQQGEECAAGIKFKQKKLSPQKSCDFIIIMGITKNIKTIKQWELNFNTRKKCLENLKKTKKFWISYIEKIKFETSDEKFNNWLKWVSVQPLMRKIAGNSFLPDFDYGKGGRGWRDLWQDLLSLILVNPEKVKRQLLNNFEGIRIDGSNATVIGKKPGEFTADRNNVSRVWMDHGVWPFFTLNLYIHQSGDFNILFSKVKYFKDFQIKRAKEKDWKWNEAEGNVLRTKDNKIYSGTILEHILIQNIIQFYNVGSHNNIKLEDADWNDGMDMASQKGESVAFTSFYAGNYTALADLLSQLKKIKKIHTIEVYEEMKILLDTLFKPISYNSIKAKKELLEKYLEKTKYTISGKKLKINIDKLISDLKKKAEWINQHLNKQEWIKTSKGLQYFNGYYDNRGKRVEGDQDKGVRMTLTGQVFPVMFGYANREKIQCILKSVMRLLWDKELNGLRLNTDFKELQPDLGRAFSFAFGHKENGSFFSHMNVMFANALYKQGWAEEGYTILNSIYKMWQNHQRSRIYPGIPEYFNSNGRGYYHYLTGSASWYMFTMLQQVFGIRGLYGDILLSPALVKEQFNNHGEAVCTASFAGKRIKIIYRNSEKLNFNQYQIKKILINNKKIKYIQMNNGINIKRKNFLKLADKGLNVIIVDLNK